MANLVFLFVFLFVPAIVGSRPASTSPLHLTGSVYCDTCRLGFETKASTPIAGVKVKLECKSKNNDAVVYSSDSVTNQKGNYEFYVQDNHGEEICETFVVSSPQSDCRIVDSGRDRARVILNRDNGMVSDERFANAMGFLVEKAHEKCSEIVKSLQELDD